MRENSEVMIIYPRVKYQFDVENPWFPQENGLQMVDFPHFFCVPTLGDWEGNQPTWNDRPMILRTH